MGSSEYSVEALVEMVGELQSRVSELEAENQQLREENQRLREKLEEKDKRIDQLEARLRQYENPHTPPSKQRSSSESSADEVDDEQTARTDGGTVGRNPGHEPAFRTPPEPDETVEVTLDTCPCCGDALGLMSDGSYGYGMRLEGNEWRSSDRDCPASG